jgi:non-canonical (house-cleaning) NTP pyrophosphatase
VIVAVGSTRGPKVDAVRRVMARLGEAIPAFREAEVTAYDASDIAPPMPLSLDEILDGARARAQLALEAAEAHGRPAALGIGLEGGIDVRRGSPHPRGLLTSWAYVTDGRRGAHGCGGAIEVPSRLLERVLRDNVELSVAIDELAGETDVRSRQGAWGVLTGGLIERTGTFEWATVNALAPFLNGELYE